MKTRITMLLAAIFAAFLGNTQGAPAFQGFSEWARNFDNRVTTEKAAMECCLPKEKVALVCKGCKTVNEKSGEDKKGVANWFKAGSMHDCSGCKGKITVRQIPAGQGTSTSISEYKHVCSKCGADSALVCATHKK